ncbi:DUF2130 domain-containing protein [Candidatus Gottesmanbacteria bacterium]|nr:DUF2130 domain-containing protein [Candidatus Gottesmanbacteria bacterium]
MTNTVVCPHCGKTIEITQAIRQQIEQEIAASIKKQTEIDLRRELTEKNLLELTDLKKQLEEKDKKVAQLRGQELTLREEKRKIEEEKKELKLEVARQLDEERKKLEEAILKQAAQEHRLKDQEKEKIINDLKKSLEDAQRKASQGSQQLQGEVQELDLEESLRTTFPSDTVEPVGKGVRGADIRHIVRTSLGNICGIILWESKRTKAWSDEWVVKLKDDLRSEKANIPIIVSTVLPDEARSGFGYKHGVLVCGFPLALSIAEIIRQRLIDVAREKYIGQNREKGKADMLYEYVTGHEFRQQIEAIVEVYNDMHTQILKERAAFEKIWKTREAQVTKMFTSTAGIVGSMRGRIGQSLPQVKGLELLEEPNHK